MLESVELGGGIFGATKDLAGKGGVFEDDGG